MSRFFVLVFLVLAINVGIQAQGWEFEHNDSTITIHDFFFWKNGHINYFGNSTDSLTYSLKMARLRGKGIVDDWIKVFLHHHYLTPDSSCIVLRNYDTMTFTMDTLNNSWYDDDFFRVIYDGQDLIYQPSQ